MDYSESNRYLEALPDWEKGPPPPGPVGKYLPRMRALLETLGHPQDRYPTVIVAGTNGKGTVASLLAALLRASGSNVGLFTSPDLHTVRERIQFNGAPVARRTWADSATRLAAVAHTFDAAQLGPFTKFEALVAMAADLFARANADLGVFEVGLGGRYDATNAWDSEMAILTPVGLDHTEVLGNTVLEIAADKLDVSRRRRLLLITSTQPPGVVDLARSHHGPRSPLQVAGSDSIEVAGSGIRVQYPWNPGRMANRPRTYIDNARLAIAAAATLARNSLTPDIIQSVVTGHHWPGRFESVRSTPPLILDGAHNPQAAERLVEDLRAIAPTWTFVVGVSQGHDASAILSHLRPLATSTILTSSGHPKALTIAELEAALPAGMAASNAPDFGRAFSAAERQSAPERALCVTGSLHIVARAREHFGLPGSGED